MTWHSQRLRRLASLIGPWTQRELRLAYRQSLLGLGWSFAQPLALAGVQALLLTQAFGVTGDGLPYLPFAWAGLVPFTYLVTALGTATPSISRAGPVIGRAAFPRELLPLACALAAGVQLGVMLAVLLVLAVVSVDGLAVTAFGALAALVTIVTWTVGLSILGAALAVFVRDAIHAIPLVVRLLFIATPIVYPVSVLPEAWRWTASINPLAVTTEALRDTILRQSWPSWPLLGVHALVGVVLLCAATSYLWRREGLMADVA